MKYILLSVLLHSWCKSKTAIPTSSFCFPILSKRCPITSFKWKKVCNKCTSIFLCDPSQIEGFDNTIAKIFTKKNTSTSFPHVHVLCPHTNLYFSVKYISRHVIHHQYCTLFMIQELCKTKLLMEEESDLIIAPLLPVSLSCTDC